MNDPYLTAGYSNMGFDPNKNDSGVHKVILDNNEIIDELMLTLKGEIIDTVKREIKQIGKPIVNDDALAWIVGRILPYTSKIIALSYLKEEVISGMIYEFAENISAELMFPDEIGIERKNRDYIKDLMVHTFTATIHKARNGETLKKLLAQHTVMEQITQEQKERKSLFPSIFKGDNKRREQLL